MMNETPDTNVRDHLRKPGSFLLLWGVPLAILVAASTFPAPALVKAMMVSTAFLWIGIACIVNAMHCGRVHCWFTGPWCVALSLLLFAYVLFDVRLAGLSFSTIANGGGIFALLLWLIPELMLGRYFGDNRH